MTAQDDLHRLVDRYLAGEATDRDVEQLDRLVAGDPQAAEYLARHARLESELTAHFRKQRKVERVEQLIEEKIEEAERNKATRAEETVSRPAALLRHTSAWAAAACLLIAASIGGYFAWLNFDRVTDPSLALHEPIALHQVLSGRVLVEGQPSSTVASEIPLKVTDDRPAEIRFSDGSHAVFEPTTKLMVHDDIADTRLAVELMEGGGTFRVTKGDGQFKVKTSIGDVTVLGTEFSVKLLPPLDGAAASGPTHQGEDMNRSALMAVVVLSGIVQVDIAGKTYTLTGGNRDVFAQDGERQLATLEDANLPPAKYEVPTGVYKVFKLVMESEPDRNGKFRNVDLRLTARDNRIVQSYVSHDMFAPQLEGLKYDGNKLTGVYIVGGSEGVNPRTAYTLDLTVAADGKVTGNYTSKTVLLAVNPAANGKDGLAGTITGKVVTEEQMAESEALDKTKNWPQSSGPTGNWHAAPFEAPILDDLNQARLVWRSEQMIGHGPGTACRRINQGRNTTCYTFTAGSAQPVVSDGKVYLSYWEPCPGYYSPRITEDTEVGYHCGKWANVEKYYGKFWADKERRHWGGHGGGIADDHVVCIDAATGKTLWHTVLPFRAWNFWDHKTAPTGLTPAVHDGKIFVMGSGHFVYGLDANSGKLLWEKADYAARPFEVWSVKGLMTSNIDILKRARANDPDVYKFERESKTNPPERNMPRLWYEDGTQMQVIGGLAIGTDFNGNYVAFDPSTGKEVWTHPMGVNGVTRAPMRLTVEGQEMLFMPSTGKAIDPKTGNELWDAKQTFHRASVSGDKIVCDGDGMTLTVFKAGKDQVQKLWSRPISSKHYVVSFISGDYIFANVESDQVVVLNAKDGTELWRQPQMIYNNPGWSAVQDRVLLRLDSAHASGTQQYVYANAGKDTKQLCNWDPPVNPTNPYNRPPGGFWTSVVVDGRIFVRGSDGIYCYDIRKTQTKTDGR